MAHAVEAAVKVAAVAGGVAEFEEHGFAVGEAAFGDVGNGVRDGGGFVEDVKGGGVGGVQSGEGFGVFFAAGLGGDHPAFRVIDMADAHGAFAGADAPPVGGDAFAAPFADFRPGFARQLFAGVSGDDAFGEGAGGHDPVDQPGGDGAFADAVATGDRHADGVYGVDAIETASFNFRAEFVQKFAGPQIGAVFTVKAALVSR